MLVQMGKYFLPLYYIFSLNCHVMFFILTVYKPLCLMLRNLIYLTYGFFFMEWICILCSIAYLPIVCCSFLLLQLNKYS
jgi:hypothetical protein